MKSKQDIWKTTKKSESALLAKYVCTYKEFDSGGSSALSSAEQMVKMILELKKWNKIK